MQPTVTPFFHAPTGTWTYVVEDPQSRRAAIVDPVLDYDWRSARTGTASAQERHVSPWFGPAGVKPIPLGQGQSTVLAGAFHEAPFIRHLYRGFLGRDVHLFLTVKVRPNWLDERERYAELGLDFPEGER